MKNIMKKAVAVICAATMVGGTIPAVSAPTMVSAANPYLPLWEHVPDGEPYVFEDPDNPGKYRVYIYGSHDTLKNAYCGPDQVVWSAPVEDPTNWRYDGVCFTCDNDNDGENDILYAPDICEVEENGKKVYYFYPNNMSGGKIVAKGDRPDGPFKVYNTSCALGGDPAIFVDDDGKVYGYWGWKESYGAQINADDMGSVVPGTLVTGLIGDCEDTDDNDFRFYEASSMRKITIDGKTKYVLIYSRWTKEGEDGLPAANSTLAYAYADAPLGPFTYGGTIVDSRAKNTDEQGNAITALPDGNTHGSICEINGKWYVFYHRQTNQTETCRQGMVDPVNIYFEGDKLIIEEAEVTSQGFETDGLDPYQVYSAGISCYLTGGPYIQATYDENVNSNPVVNLVNGSVVGYKYFNFDDAVAGSKLEMAITPAGADGSVKIMVDSPWTSKGGKELASFEISGSDPRMKNIYTVDVDGIKDLEGKHAVYFLFSSESAKSMATFYDFAFTKDGNTVLVGETKEPYFGKVDRSKWSAVSSSDAATGEEENAAKAFDDSTDTRWTSGKNQSGDESYILNMGNVWSFNEIRLYGQTDYPRGYKISVSEDGTVYKEVAEGTCDATADPYLTIRFEKQRAQYIKIEQTKALTDDFKYWSIYDLNVYYNDPAQISKAGWTATVEGTDAWWNTEKAFDDVEDEERWTTCAEQVGGEAFLLNMGAVQTFNEIVLYGTTDYPRGYEVSVSQDGTQYTQIADGLGNADEKGYLTIRFDTQTAQYIKIAQTKTAPGTWWSINELYVKNIVEEVAPTPTPEVKLPFTDVNKDKEAGNDWYYEAVVKVFETGLMTGMNDTYFGAYEEISRAQFAVILYRMEGEPEAVYNNEFPDVKENEGTKWYTSAVAWANKNGLITGYTHNGHFGAADPITREQLATILYRYAQWKGYDLGEGADFNTFNDAAKVSGFAKDALSWAVGSKIITGKDKETRLDPQGTAKRAECATVIMRFMEHLKIYTFC